MYVSRLTFHTLPGKTQETEEKLAMLRHWVEEVGGLNPRVQHRIETTRKSSQSFLVMRTHYGSSGAPDLVFEQEVADPGVLEQQIKKVTNNTSFQEWAQQVSLLLEQPSKRELYCI